LAQTADLKQGSIIWVNAPDPGGRNPKVRAFVVITATAAINSCDPMVAVAVTGTFREPLDPLMVPMRWNTAGTTETGFRKKCVARCDWAIVVPTRKIQKTIEFDGDFDGRRVREVELLKIMERVESHRNTKKR
jgi:mRNA-degrading endonuclease toxin of MazEF toxin-antitoxin module